MHRRAKFLRALGSAVALLAIGVLITAGNASAHEGEYARFNYCPSTNAEVFKCIYSVTGSGEVVLGKKKVPIVNAVTLQGGFSKANEAGFSAFYGATNGDTLSKTPQPVPGGLAGLVNCKEISSTLLRISCEAVFENGLTGVNSTLELARPATEIKISEANLATEEGVALEMPVKVHLENPLLGSTCYVGSNGSPLIWKLTTGETSPPGPNTSIHGFAGETEFLAEGRIAKINNGKLVDNAWSAPGASGCGGPIAELLLDPIINASTGVPAASGRNTAVLNTTNYLATAKAVNSH